MSKRSQRPPSPKPTEGPRTLADVKKLPVEEQRKVLGAELAGIDRAIERLHIDRATIHGALSMIED